MDGKQKKFQTAKKIRYLTCKKCGHEWIPRSKRVRMCPNCKSVRWSGD